MSKRTEGSRRAASPGRGQAMQLTYRMPRVPDPPTLRVEAKRRLQIVEFAGTHGVALAVEAHGVSRSTIYPWRKQYHPHKCAPPIPAGANASWWCCCGPKAAPSPRPRSAVSYGGSSVPDG